MGTTEYVSRRRGHGEAPTSVTFFFAHARDALDDDRPPTRVYARTYARHATRTRIRARKSSSTQKSVRVSANLFSYICYKVGLVSACVRISGMLCKQRAHKWLACARRAHVFNIYASTRTQTARVRGTRAHARTATRSRI